MSNYIPSVNIESGLSKDFNYIVTPNVQAVLGQIVNDYRTGFHAFTVIGTYGTGKSSFIMALERDLNDCTHSTLVGAEDLFVPAIGSYEFLNILGDYAPLCQLMGEKLGCNDVRDTRNVLAALKHRYKQVEKRKQMLVIVVDEFGKILEHAAKHDTENELYFLQRLAEFCNDDKNHVLLLTTLHQNFGTYAQRLTEAQRQEWMKVKGRFREVAFSEPVEQLLFMASRKLEDRQLKIEDPEALMQMLSDAKTSKFVSQSLNPEITCRLYPLDPFAANCLTQAIQRYGQNERTLFSFLSAKGKGSLEEFVPTATLTYNMASVYDYVTYSFFATLAVANADSMNWSAMHEALDRVESGIFPSIEQTEEARRLVKSIGMINLFGGSGVNMSEHMLLFYAQKALDISNPGEVLSKLVQHKVVRYAEYKHQYILFEGTDIDIEHALLSANGKVPKPTANVQELGEYIEARVVSAVAEYYRKGTPRYFEYLAENDPTVVQPKDDVDGTIQLVFPLAGMTLEHVKEKSAANAHANVYVYFNNVDQIVKHLHQIKKLQYLIGNVVMDDRVARREINLLLEYEKHQLNEAINASIVAGDRNVTWIFRGKEITVDSQGALKKLLSAVCEEVYYKTPVLRNELFNRQKLSSAISMARVNLLDALLEHSEEADLGFEAKAFPPEKTIYYSLLKDTGMHRPMDDSDTFVLGEPNQGIVSLWEASDRFLRSTIEKPRKLGEFIKILREAPYKLKQGVIDFWLPVFLFTRQQDFALYNGDGVFVMKITKEVFELLQKRPNDFSVKAFEMEGVKMEYFHQYRKLLKNTSPEDALNSNTFLQTIKPFIGFYRQLNEYAKSTRKFDHAETARFRDVLANAKDPEKAFFVDLPEALGLKSEDLLQGDEMTNRVRLAMNELRNCYDELLARIEACMVKALDLPHDYESYKEEIAVRYATVREGLLTQKSRIFLERLLAPSATAREFWEKVCNAVLDKRLEQLKDKEEERLMDDMQFMFRELDRYVDISQLDDFMTNDEAYSFEMASTKGATHKQQTFRLSGGQVAQASSIEQKVLSQLSGDENLDVCVLLRLLNEKLAKK